MKSKWSYFRKCAAILSVLVTLISGLGEARADGSVSIVCGQEKDGSPHYCTQEEIVQAIQALRIRQNEEGEESFAHKAVRYVAIGSSALAGVFITDVVLAAKMARTGIILGNVDATAASLYAVGGMGSIAVAAASGFALGLWPSSAHAKTLSDFYATPEGLGMALKLSDQELVARAQKDGKLAEILRSAAAGVRADKKSGELASSHPGVADKSGKPESSAVGETMQATPELVFGAAAL